MREHGLSESEKTVERGGRGVRGGGGGEDGRDRTHVDSMGEVYLPLRHPSFVSSHVREDVGCMCRVKLVANRTTGTK